MRFLVALLAVIGLLASPAVAAAAQASCYDHYGGATMHMAMTDMPGMTHTDGQMADPCCDPAKSAHSGRHDMTDCAQACAAMCGVIAALPSDPAAYIAPSDRGAPPQGRVA
jgi:hypothetical protein